MFLLGKRNAFNGEDEKMSRVKVWIEAYEEFVITRGLATLEITGKMSDDEVSKYVFSIVEEKRIRQEFNEFVHKYCMQYK